MCACMCVCVCVSTPEAFVYSSVETDINFSSITKCRYVMKILGFPNHEILNSRK